MREQVEAMLAELNARHATMLAEMREHDVFGTVFDSMFIECQAIGNAAKFGNLFLNALKKLEEVDSERELA